MFDHVKKLLQEMDPAEATLHSYLNYHAKGLTYLCLHRSPTLTEKLYYFDETTGNPFGRDNHVVSPHSHNYDFRSTLIHGALTNYRFRETRGKDWWVFDYRSPLNGGNGASTPRECGLATESIETLLVPGESYALDTHEIHTIGAEPKTLLHLQQYRDKTLGSRFYSMQKAAPNIDGLYVPMTEEDVTLWRNKFLHDLALMANAQRIVNIVASRHAA